MRIILTALIALAAGVWLLTWWLLEQPIGAPSTTLPAVVGEPNVVAPSRPPPSGAGARGAQTALPTPGGSPTPAGAQPSASSVPSQPAPAFPGGVVVDPFADGGPRAVFVDPARRPETAPAPPRADGLLAPPPPGAAPAPRGATGRVDPGSDDAARQRSGSSERP